MQSDKQENRGHGNGDDHGDQEEKNVHVIVENEDDGESYHLNAKATEPLSALIGELYEKKLRRERRDGDRLRCEKGGEDVFGFEALSFRDYLDQGHCPKLEWLFSGKTGGAGA